MASTRKATTTGPAVATSRSMQLLSQVLEGIQRVPGMLDEYGHDAIRFAAAVNRFR